MPHTEYLKSIRIWKKDENRETIETILFVSICLKATQKLKYYSFTLQIVKQIWTNLVHPKTGFTPFLQKDFLRKFLDQTARCKPDRCWRVDPFFPRCWILQECRSSKTLCPGIEEFRPKSRQIFQGNKQFLLLNLVG